MAGREAVVDMNLSLRLSAVVVVVHCFTFFSLQFPLGNYTNQNSGETFLRTYLQQVNRYSAVGG